MIVPEFWCLIAYKKTFGAQSLNTRIKPITGLLYSPQFIPKNRTVTLDRMELEGETLYMINYSTYI